MRRIDSNVVESASDELHGGVGGVEEEREQAEDRGDGGGGDDASVDAAEGGGVGMVREKNDGAVLRMECGVRNGRDRRVVLTCGGHICSSDCLRIIWRDGCLFEEEKV